MWNPIAAKTETSGQTLPAPAFVQAKSRRQSYELLRVLCTFPIIMAHVHAPGFDIAHVAIAMFLILSLRLSTGSFRIRPLPEVMVNRAKRILWPWLVWCGIYLGLNWVRFGPAAFVPTGWTAFLIGPSLHLWFLPFLYILTPLAWVLSRLPVTAWGYGMIALAGAVFGLGGFWLEQAGGLSAPFVQWASVLPAVMLGMMLDRWSIWLPVGFCVALCGLGALLGHVDLALYMALGLGVLLAFARLDLPGNWAGKLGAATLGVYLVHPAIILVCGRFLPFAGNEMAISTLVFSLSLLGTFVYTWAAIWVSRPRVGPLPA